ncbi:LysE/ArgO family amino acid transporter [Nocardiopsis sp. JB363]|uniref:LysE/ArgO family amino acid transporter n=1 Tax=Nocardiopsis sp. JB363 TaxID=1434837 RepID=UPI00097A1BAD|nr:LysE/ArgO family amino acid transporter [Nocardiopsis sp. JB363]SIO88039.1 Transporter, LysE family [Nocardiopsis sp. JB363]
MNETLLPALLGLGTGLALIVAIGAQNAYLLRLGIEGNPRTILAVVLVCACSDAMLIAAGVVGIGGLVQAMPAALVVIRILGAGFLIVYGLLAAHRALKPGPGEALVPAEQEAETVRGGSGTTLRTATRTRGSLRAAVLTALALTWLNPHVYLDTVVFLGSLANQQVGDARWWWAAGALTGSFVWFFALGFGARLLRPFFARPGSWRVLDGIIAVVMLALGVRLAFGV